MIFGVTFIDNKKILFQTKLETQGGQHLAPGHPTLYRFQTEAMSMPAITHLSNEVREGQECQIVECWPRACKVVDV